MLKLERRLFIERELHEESNVLVSELSEVLGCSEETIRRGIREMEAAGKPSKAHGGAYLSGGYDKDIPIELREPSLASEKEQMADKAADIAKDHSVIMLNSSAICPKLVETTISPGRCITSITSPLRISSLFNSQSSNVNLICSGGQFHRATTSLTGCRMTDTLKQNFADITFISCPTLHLQHGLSDNNLNEAKARKHMLESSHYKTLAVGHTKFDSISNILFYGLAGVDLPITDQPLSKTWEKYCRKSFIEIIYS